MTLQRIHIANSGGRNARVLVLSTTARPSPRTAKNGTPTSFHRYVAAGESLLDSDLQSRFDGPYAEALIEGDPEVDLEAVGRFIRGTHAVLIAGDGVCNHRSG